MKRNLIDRYLLLAPGIRTIVECAILLGAGILGIVFKWTKIPYFPISNILGGLIFIFGYIIHVKWEKIHRQHDDAAESIVGIVKEGIFSKIRHPLYLTVILIDMGIGLAFSDIYTVCIATILSISCIRTAFLEEAYLQKKFPEYKDYMNQVRWRMIPGIF